MLKTLVLKVTALDWKKWLRNTAIFLAPAVLMSLLALQAGHSLVEVTMLLKLWMLNASIDLLRKFIAANPEQ